MDNLFEITIDRYFSCSGHCSYCAVERCINRVIYDTVSIADFDTDYYITK